MPLTHPLSQTRLPGPLERGLLYGRPHRPLCIGASEVYHTYMYENWNCKWCLTFCWGPDMCDKASGVARVGLTRGGNRRDPNYFWPFETENFAILSFLHNKFNSSQKDFITIFSLLYKQHVYYITNNFPLSFFNKFTHKILVIFTILSTKFTNIFFLVSPLEMVLPGAARPRLSTPLQDKAWQGEGSTFLRDILYGRPI